MKAMPAKEQPMTEYDSPPADSVLDALGETCADLTPLIRARMRGLDSGGVLEVRTDDPSARVDIPAWSRLTGNELITVIEGDSEHTRFYLQKK
jgi:TusA-related sulfurtransferase